MSAIRLALRRIALDGPMPPEERIRSTFAIIARQAERLELMLGDILELARIEAGRLELRVEDADLRALCDGAVALMADTSPVHEVLGPGAGPAVSLRCDPVRIEQVLVNLLSNAIKYSPAGGRIAVGLDSGGGRAAVWVDDPGVGVDEDERELIFEPFRRSRRTSEAVPGSGLGLHAVKRIVEAHGGSVAVSRRPGGGSRFRVELPLEVPGRPAHADVHP
jgi:signal transduction histidine kinase